MFEAVTAVTLWVVFLLFVTGGYRRFGGIYRLHQPKRW
jgi:hypothetical protein